MTYTSRASALPELEAVAERILDEQAVDPGDLRVVGEGDGRGAQAGAQQGEPGDDEPGVGLARRGEGLLDADVRRSWRPARNQQPPLARIGSGLRKPSSIPSSAP